MKFVNQTVLLLAILACAAIVTFAQQHSEAEGGDKEEIKGGLFDFVNYKRLFKKTYSGLPEQAARIKYFISSALQVAAGAIAYRFRKKNYYLAINDMSDYSPEELAMMKNKEIFKWASQLSTSKNRAGFESPEGIAEESSQLDLVPKSGENVLRELIELVEKHEDEPVYRELGKLIGQSGPTSDKQHVRRRKREAVDERTKRLPLRNLPLDKLIGSSDRAMTPQAQAKLRTHVPSNNPNYRPIELNSQGLRDDQVDVHWYTYESHGNAIDKLEVLLDEISIDKRHFAKVKADKERARLQDSLASPNSRDQVFADLRKTGCLSEVRNQGKCGACYVFASVAIMEFLHCKNTGDLVPFSEQYVLDCGKEFVEGMNGCDGGSPTNVAHFARNFGMHLLSQYPYRVREELCPYGEDAQVEETGYIRSDDFGKASIISAEFWPEALKYGPLFIAVAANKELEAYGGGVWMGEGCPESINHAVVLVGHGREDGREYWLYRNSWAASWGEHGYGKIDKESACYADLGFAYGASNPKNMGQMKFVENEAHDKSLLASKTKKPRQNWRNKKRGLSTPGPF